MIKSICVYCGSSEGIDPKMKQMAYELGQTLAREQINLVYGGAKIGLMGAVAQGTLDLGGQVLGIIPAFLDHVEISNHQVTELIVTQSMHERKTLMAQHSDAFIALPGGMGTLEEISEILTWSQLGLVNCPVGFLNIDGYYDHLFALFHHMNLQGLLKSEHLKLYVSDDQVSGLISKIKAFEPSQTSMRQKLGLI